jgi:hypothetical protein
MTASRKYARNPGQDQIRAWKQAIAERNRQQRRNRWRRPAPPVTGIRIPAPSDKTQDQREDGQHDGADTTRST